MGFWPEFRAMNGEPDRSISKWFWFCPKTERNQVQLVVCPILGHNKTQLSAKHFNYSLEFVM